MSIARAASQAASKEQTARKNVRHVPQGPTKSTPEEQYAHRAMEKMETMMGALQVMAQDRAAGLRAFAMPATTASNA